MASVAFGKKQRPAGKEFRDGTVGEALDDIYADVEAACDTLEKSRNEGAKAAALLIWATGQDASTTNTVTLGTGADAVVYEFVTAAGQVAADANIGVALGADSATDAASLVAAINGTAAADNGLKLQSDNTKAAKTTGGQEKKVKATLIADWDGGGNSQAIEIKELTVGGADVIGTGSDFALTEAGLHQAIFWSDSNLNATGAAAGAKPTCVVSMPAASGDAGIFVKALPKGMKGASVIEGHSINTGGTLSSDMGADTIEIVSAASDNPYLKLTCNGGGNDLADGAILTVRVS